MTSTGPAPVRLRTDDGVACRLAVAAADRAVHHEIRRSVFVGEQGVFQAHDLDERDDTAATLHVLGLVDGVPAGTVRLYPLDARAPVGDWQGDRLAVLPPFRSRRVGGPLVEFAVRTAARRGGRRMIAHVQASNGAFFRRLGWNQLGEELYVGLPHLLMDIDLTALDL
jgi:putative N-acetyltransferase (TIGR04045 family)